MTTDMDVIAAIEQKKEQINKIPFDVRRAEELWVFNHLHTVLNHTKKIFETDLNIMIDDMKKEVNNARNHD